MTTQEPQTDTRTIEIAGALSRAEAEVLQLEVRRLARLHGLDVVGVRVERSEDP